MNCEKVTYWIEKGYFTDLKISEKIQVKIHSLICNDCRHYETDSQAVNDILKLLSEETGTESLTKTEKDKIKKALQEIKK